MTLDEFQIEILRTKRLQTQTECEACINLCEKYVDHVSRLIFMLRKTERVMQEALIELETSNSSASIFVIKKQLSDCLTHRKEYFNEVV